MSDERKLNYNNLMQMKEVERENLLRDEVEKIINCAPPERVLKLRKLQAEIDGIRRRIKDPYYRTALIMGKMLVSFEELRAYLNNCKPCDKTVR